MRNKIIAIALLVLLGAGGTFVLLRSEQPPVPAEETETKTPQEERSDSEEASGSSETYVLLNNFGQRDDGTVYANATVRGASDGTCEFRFTHDEASVSETAEVEYVPTGYYACGVRLQSNEFTPKGVWTAQVRIQNVEPAVESETRQAEIK